MIFFQVIKDETASRAVHAKRTPTLASDSLMSLWASVSLSFSFVNCADTTQHTHTHTHKHTQEHMSQKTQRGKSGGGLDRQRREGTLVHYSRYRCKTHREHKKGRKENQGKEDVPYTWKMGGQRHFPILCEWVIWCAKGTVLLHLKQDVIHLQKKICVKLRRQHERNKEQHHWQSVHLQTLFSHFPAFFFLFGIEKHVQLNTLRCVMGTDFTVQPLF